MKSVLYVKRSMPVSVLRDMSLFGVSAFLRKQCRMETRSRNALHDLLEHHLNVPVYGCFPLSNDFLPQVLFFIS
jgi:hypothetical protein